MHEQGELFDGNACDAAAERRREARAEAVKFSGSQRRRILLQLLDRPSGLTADELERELRMSGSSVRPRLLELLEVRAVVRTTLTRRTASGGLALVWKAAPYAP